MIRFVGQKISAFFLHIGAAKKHIHKQCTQAQK